MKPLVIILMGSSSDMDHAEKIASELKTFGIEYAIRIGSAHKTVEHVVSMLKEYEALDRPKLCLLLQKCLPLNLHSLKRRKMKQLIISMLLATCKIGRAHV